MSVTSMPAGPALARWFGLIAVIAVLFVAAGSGRSAAAAGNPLVDVPETGQQGGILTLRSSNQPVAVPALRPGQSFSWQVAANLSNLQNGVVNEEITGSELQLRVESTGSWVSAPDGYGLTVQMCSAEWTDSDGVDVVAACPAQRTGGTARAALAGIAPATMVPLGMIAVDRPGFASITLDLPADSTLATASGGMSIRLGFTVGGQTAVCCPPPAAPSLPAAGAAPSGMLSWTGFALLPYLAVGLSAVAGGVLLARLAGRVQKRSTP